tara:strand:- start:17867 stop:18160 length:294 start_codon:yes stop_codon:yes gene_type:complete
METMTPIKNADVIDGRKQRDFINKPNRNLKTYKYFIEWNEDGNELTKDCRSIADIIDCWGIPKSSIYLLLKGIEMKKYKGYKVTKINKPAQGIVYFD